MNNKINKKLWTQRVRKIRACMNHWEGTKSQENKFSLAAGKGENPGSVPTKGSHGLGGPWAHVRWQWGGGAEAKVCNWPWADVQGERIERGSPHPGKVGADPGTAVGGGGGGVADEDKSVAQRGRWCSFWGSGKGTEEGEWAPEGDVRLNMAAGESKAKSCTGGLATKTARVSKLRSQNPNPWQWVGAEGEWARERKFCARVEGQGGEGDVLSSGEVLCTNTETRQGRRDDRAQDNSQVPHGDAQVAGEATSWGRSEKERFWVFLPSRPKDPELYGLISHLNLISSPCLPTE